MSDPADAVAFRERREEYYNRLSNLHLNSPKFYGNIVNTWIPS